MRQACAGLVIGAHDLRELYRGQNLSTYKIAAIYGCDPKTIYRRLILNNIPTRKRKKIHLTPSILRLLYIKEQRSLAAIAHLHGHSAAGILKKLRQYRIERRTLSETSTKHPKHDFKGSLHEKSYLIGFRLGDLGIRKRANLIYVSSGTTKQAQINLICSLFRPYGPVWIGRPDGRRAINVSCALNDSFSFLLPKHNRIPEWIRTSNRFLLSFLAGYVDAEGNIYISDEMAKFRLRSCDVGILRDIRSTLGRMGISSLFGIDRKAGVDKRGVKLNADSWFLTINNKADIFMLLHRLYSLLRHQKRKEDAAQALKNVKLRLSR